MCACTNTSTTRVARLLVTHGADVNAKVPDTGLTALHLAGKAGHSRMVSFLLSKGADVTAADVSAPPYHTLPRRAVLVLTPASPPPFSPTPFGCRASGAPR